jgi:hypothetical protein
LCTALESQQAETQRQQTPTSSINSWGHFSRPL